ncbi:hypothetical protein JCM10207_009303 [Rhodosporidiobolus poonsookiae]
MPDRVADALAECALATYASLPPKGKPSRLSNSTPSWTILAAFLVYRQIPAGFEVRCASLGTGLKALPHARLPVHGDLLHDCHAEVVARRGFKLWLYGQLEKAARGDEEGLLERVEKPRGAEWRLKEGWKVGVYVSTLPCGDASTYLLSLQPAASSSCSPTTPLDAPPVAIPASLPSPAPPAASPTPHPSLLSATLLGLSLSRTSPSPSSPSPSPSSAPQVLRGRLNYALLSTLRTKPGRADSPPTTSHSCSDKLAQWGLCGAQGGLLSAAGVGRVPIAVLVVGSEGVPCDPAEREKVRCEIARAVGGRVEPWARTVGLSEGEEGYDPSAVEWTERRFGHSRESVAEREGWAREEVAGCVESLSYVASATPSVEVTTNFLRQGASSKRKNGAAFGPKSRSRLCKLSLFERHVEVDAKLDAAFPSSSPPSPSPSSSAPPTYYTSKHPPLPPLPSLPPPSSAPPSPSATSSSSSAPPLPLSPAALADLSPAQRYQFTKALARSVRPALPAPANEEGGGAREGRDEARGLAGPFAGWLVSGEAWEGFTVEGEVRARTEEGERGEGREEESGRRGEEE